MNDHFNSDAQSSNWKRKKKNENGSIFYFSLNERKEKEWERDGNGELFSVNLF